MTKPLTPAEKSAKKAAAVQAKQKATAAAAEKAKAAASRPATPPPAAKPAETPQQQPETATKAPETVSDQPEKPAVAGATAPRFCHKLPNGDLRVTFDIPEHFAENVLDRAAEQKITVEDYIQDYFAVVLERDGIS